MPAGVGFHEKDQVETYVRNQTCARLGNGYLLDDDEAEALAHQLVEDWTVLYDGEQSNVVRSQPQSFTRTRATKLATDISLDAVRDCRRAHRPLHRAHPTGTLARPVGACGVDVWLKFECFQLTGSFKLRGALNALMLLDAPTQVVTASAGNHGLGVARAAALLGVGSTVVVPETASQVKVDALRHSGAELVQVGDTYDDAEAAAIRLADEQGLPFISAYNDAAVIAGGGTVALEVVEDLPSVRALIVPAGGGGLISGVGIAAHGLDPEVRVCTACNPRRCPRCTRRWMPGVWCP